MDWTYLSDLILKICFLDELLHPDLLISPTITERSRFGEKGLKEETGRHMTPLSVDRIPSSKCELLFRASRWSYNLDKSPQDQNRSHAFQILFVQNVECLPHIK